MIENKNLSFKQAFEELQKILQKLETKEYNIEEITELYKNGLELKKYCSDILEKEKSKIKIIAEKNGVSLEELGFDKENKNGE
jgi:exodeoxyribonuclease VII small subunit